MKKLLLILFFPFITQSCIPIKSAPRIENYRILEGREFKKGLPPRQTFVFEDKQDVNAFYDFIDHKFQLGNEQVMDDVPFRVNGHQYFFSFYEVDKSSKTINLFPFLLSVATKSEDREDPEMVKNDYYYIAIETYSDLENDCLAVDALSREPVLKYLRKLKEEYQNAQDLDESLSKN